MASDLIVEFQEYVRHHLKDGQDGRGTASYIPRQFLADYWTRARVRGLLDSCVPPLPENESHIMANFLRIFSTLVYTGHPRDIRLFVTKDRNDDHLPFDEHSPQWMSSLTGFLESQWMFAPLEFTRDVIWNRELAISRIIPVTIEGSLREDHRGDGAARIERVRLHPGCHSGVSEDGLAVFKTYEGAEGQRQYNAESAVYGRLLGLENHGITQFYGSFWWKHTEKRTIVLEYAKYGSLLNYIQTTRPPVLLEEFQMLWTRLLDLLVGLHTLHNLSSGTGPSGNNVAGAHMDIQLANILVFPQSDESPFNVRFKLADFGLSALSRVSEDLTLTINDEGNRMYSAAECYPNHAIQDKIKTNVTPAADVWALGAVFSDVFAWSILGEDGREKYRVRRKQAIASLDHLRASGFDACFHDGTDQRLPAVDDFHDHLLNNIRRSDVISPHMSDVILGHMLTAHPARRPPWEVRTRAEERIRLSRLSSPVDVVPSRALSQNGGSPVSLGGFSHAPHSQHPRHSMHSVPSRSSHHLPQCSSTGYPQRRTISTPERRSSLVLRSESDPYLQNSPVDELEATKGEPLASFPSRSTPNSASIQPSQDYSPVTRVQNSIEPSTAPHPPTLPLGPRTPGSNTVPSRVQELVTVERVYEILSKKHSQSSMITNTFNWVQNKIPKAMRLPGMEDARTKVIASGGRDQIFLIDNYSSMRPNKEKLIKTASVISYVTKTADDDGMDLYFASESTTPRKCTTSREVESALKAMSFVEGRCNMKLCLENILGSFPSYLRRKTSVYVFTDAIWEPGDDDVDSVIHMCINQLVKHNKSPLWLMFQFIQFGDDTLGKERLRHLDDDCAEPHDLGKYDIVDTKHCDDHVPDIVVGSISPFVDGKTASN